MIAGRAPSAQVVVADERRYLTHSQLAISTGRRLSVAGILREETVLDLQPDAVVNPLLPHDAAIVIERTEPDLVLVESGALVAGQPWAGTGEPSMSGKASRLLRVLDATLDVGRPAVLWWSDERNSTPSLIPFEGRFDFVLDGRARGRPDMYWAPGVQLSRFGTVATGGERDPKPAWHARWDRMPPRSRRIAADAATAGPVDHRPELWIDAAIADDPAWLPAACRGEGVVRVAASELPERYRRRAAFVAERTGSPDVRSRIAPSVLRQLAAGARVVSPPDTTLRRALRPWIEWAPDDAAVPAALEAALSRGPRPVVDQRRLIRRLFADHDTSRAVQALADLIGAPRGTPRRQVCAVARLDEDDRPESFVDAITMQQLRPTHALLAAADERVAGLAIDELGRLGIPARVLPPTTPGRHLARWAADHTSAEWIWVWSRRAPRSPTVLIDGVLTAMCSGAIAVGYRGATPAEQALDDPPAIIAHDAASSIPDDVTRSGSRWWEELDTVRWFDDGGD
jgi:hypothetical protein